MKTTLTAVAAMTLVLAASACGSSSSAAGPGPAATSTTVGTTTTALIVERPSQLVDEMISVEGGRMHLRCVGAGATTVVLIAGWDGGGDTWGAIEPAIAEHARVCSYRAPAPARATRKRRPRPSPPKPPISMRYSTQPGNPARTPCSDTPSEAQRRWRSPRPIPAK